VGRFGGIVKKTFEESLWNYEEDVWGDLVEL